MLIITLSVALITVKMCTDVVVRYKPSSMDCIQEALPAVGVANILMIFIPMGVNFLTNTAILYIVITSPVCGVANGPGSRKSLRKAITTTSAISWIFIISWTPWMILITLDLLGYSMASWYWLSSRFIISLNVISNPVVYTITNQRFANYLLHIVKAEVSESVIFNGPRALRLSTSPRMPTRHPWSNRNALSVSSPAVERWRMAARRVSSA